MYLRFKMKFGGDMPQKKSTDISKIIQKGMEFVEREMGRQHRSMDKSKIERSPFKT